MVLSEERLFAHRGVATMLPGGGGRVTFAPLHVPPWRPRSYPHGAINTSPRPRQIFYLASI